MAKKIDPCFWLQLFDKNGHAVAERDFIFGGETYERCDYFPWRKLGLNEVELRGLWLADHIAFFDAKAAGFASGDGFVVPTAPATPTVQRFVASPGERVDVALPARPPAVAKRAQRRA